MRPKNKRHFAEKSISLLNRNVSRKVIMTDSRIEDCKRRGKVRRYK